MAMFEEMKFVNFRKFETELAGRPLVVETGKMAQLAGGSCLIRYGETEVLCNATASAKPREGVDFFPLSVDFEEKLYSVGKIPGSFGRREGKPSDKAILASRVIDRPIRPLFPKDMRNDVGVVATVMSVDPDCSPVITAMIGVSIAISISDIPWDGPISGVEVGLVEGEIVINPTAEQEEKSEMKITVASTDSLVAMIEAGANEVADEDVYDGIMKGHEANQKIVEFIKGIQAEIGREKFAFESNDPDPEMYEAVKEFCIEDVKKALDTDDKRVRDEALKPIYEAVHAKFDEIYPEQEEKLEDCLYKLQKFIVRRWLLDEGKRVDGRNINQIRPLAAEVDVLSRVHGSGLFTRGQTQVLTVATLGSVDASQKLDGIDNEDKKRYIHHYNFPSYSVGETRPSRGPGRREIGHGALAEKALLPVIPSVEEFPYTMRLVSEVVSSNGSTSQGSICASTLALMAAGVPIKAPVAGTISNLAYVAGETTKPEEAAAVIQVDGKGYTVSFSVTNEQSKKVQVGDVAELQNAWYYDDAMATLAVIKPDPESNGQKKLLVFNVTGSSIQAGQSLSLSVGQRSAEYELTVPNSAIREDKNGKFILIVESKSGPISNRYIATRVDVEVLASDDNNTAISAGLYGYEYVITTSTKPVEAGKQVRLNENNS